MSRRPHYTPDEMQAVLNDRAKHSHLTVIDWAKQHGIATSLFYKFQKRLAKLTKPKMGRPPGAKTRVKTTKVAKTTTTAFAYAVGQIKHWRAEATKLAEQLIQESLTE